MFKLFNGHLFVVFTDEDAATKKYWLYGKILRRQWVCFNGYFNAFQIW